MRGGNLIDLDWLIDITRTEFPLAMSSAEQLFSSGREFYMCACRSDDYTPGYFNPTADNWLDLIKASSAIPGFTGWGSVWKESAISMAASAMRFRCVKPPAVALIPLW